MTTRTFKGKKGLGRAVGQERVREARSGKLSKLRGKEQRALGSPKSFDAAANPPTRRK